MANKPLQSIKFPDLPDTYIIPVVDSTLAVSGAAADAKQTGDSLADKVDKVSGKGLSTEDYTTGEKTKLANVETEATKTIIDNTLTQTGQAADAKAVGDAIASEDKKALAAFATDTASGAVANFPDGADNIPMKDVLVHIEPVQAGSGDPSPENVRPITGWTAANISRAGKNLCINTNFVAGEVDGITYTMNDDGSINCNGASTGQAIKWLLNNTNRYILPSGNYILSGGANVSPEGVRIVISINRRISGTIEYIDETSSAGVPFAINDGDTIRGIYLRINKSAVLVSNATIYPMIRPAAFTDNTYEPYAAPAIYNVSFPTEAGTVYGGTLDVTKGELVVDRAIIASYAGETLPSTWISDRDVYSEGTTPTTGAQVCYYLATPITYTLTPQEITSLLGVNNLWADTGDSEVEYRADAKLYITKKITEAVSALS